MTDDGEQPAVKRRGRPPALSIDERRHVVLDAAVEIFGAEGVPSRSVDAVAAVAGLQKPSIYRLFESRAGLFTAVVEREVGRFVTVVDELYAATAELPLEERIDARADGILAHVERDPSSIRLLVRAFHSWPGDDLERATELRGAVLRVIEAYAVEEAARGGLDLGRGAALIAATTFALTELAVELLLEEHWARADLAPFLSRAMLGCVVAAASLPDETRAVNPRG